MRGGGGLANQDLKVCLHWRPLTDVLSLEIFVVLTDEYGRVGLRRIRGVSLTEISTGEGSRTGAEDKSAKVPHLSSPYSGLMNKGPNFTPRW